MVASRRRGINIDVSCESVRASELISIGVKVDGMDGFSGTKVDGLDICIWDEANDMDARFAWGEIAKKASMYNESGLTYKIRGTKGRSKEVVRCNNDASKEVGDVLIVDLKRYRTVLMVSLNK